MKKIDFYNITNEEERQTSGFYTEKLDFILREVGKGKNVLDIGCNNGFVGEKLVRNNNEVYGVDIVDEDLKAARKKGILVKKLDIEEEDLPYSKSFFDVIILADIIEHVFDTDALLYKCHRVLKRGGKLIVTTPNVASLGRRIMLLLGISPFLEYSLHMTTNGLPSVGHIRYYTQKTLIGQLKHTGFIDIHIEGDGISLPFFKLKQMGKITPSLSTMLMTRCRKK